MWNTPAARRLTPHRAARFVRSGTIASATRPFNIGELTMSDFGDVEELR
jgi:hypothetical protein